MGKFEGAGFDKIIFLNWSNGWYYNNTSHFFWTFHQTNSPNFYFYIL